MSTSKPTDKQVQLFESKLLHILIDMFGDNKALLKHMLEPTDRIILKKEDLIALVVVLTGSHDVQISVEPYIKKTCAARWLGHSCCVSLSRDGVCPVRVTKILVDGADFFIHYNELYNLFDRYNVYTDCCFAIDG